MKYGAKGPNIPRRPRARASSHATGEGCTDPQRVCDVVIAGGAEATITPLGWGVSAP